MLSINLKKQCLPLTVPFFITPIRAGFPSPAADYAEEGLDFNELLVQHKAATYCLRVTGDSMSGAGIFPGDILVVDRSLKPVDGDIIVAAVEGEFTVKRLVLRHGRVALHPENHAYAPMYIDGQQELEVFGVVTSVVRKYNRART